MTVRLKIFKRVVVSLLATVLIPIVAVGAVSHLFPGSIDYDHLLHLIAGKTFFADIYVKYPSGETKNISPSDDGIYYQPHINAKGNKVVFFGNDSGPPRVWIAELETGKTFPLTPETSGARHAVFSWDGTMIAFASDRSHVQNPERIEYMRGNGLPPDETMLNLFVMDSDGQNVRQITQGPYQDQRPTFSPDRKTLAFVSNRGGENQLWAVRVEGDGIPIRLQHEGWGYRPWYSADGKWIYFFSGVNNRHQICKIPASGGPKIPMANDDKGTSHGPFVDLNSDVLLIHSTRGGQFGIWELPLNGAPPTQILLSQFGDTAAHATRSRNGILAFDVYRKTLSRQIGSTIKRLLRE